jgi:hypothetical protein
MEKEDPKQKQLRLERSEAKRLALKRVEAMSGESEWNILQQLAQDIEAYYVAKNEKKPSVDDMLNVLITKEINTKYPDTSPEETIIREALLDAIPSRMTIHKWRHKKGWDEAVWARVRGAGLFTADKRAVLINTLYEQANDGNVTAAKIWLTLSGDYQEKDSSIKNDIVDQFREINQILHNKK